MEPSEALDRAIEAYHYDRALRALGRDTDAGPSARHAAGRGVDAESWLLSVGARDALGELRDRPSSLGSLHRAVSEHRSRIAFRRRVRPCAQAMARVLSGQVRVGEDVVGFPSALSRVALGPDSELLGLVRGIDAALEEVVRAYERLADAPPDEQLSAPAPESILERATAFLEATDDLAEEVEAYMLLRERSWFGMLRAFATNEAGSPFHPDGRWRRVAERVSGLGFARELQGRVRVERAQSWDPRPSLSVLRAPLDLRILPSSLELGLPSEVFALEALGRALSHALITPALPAALRRPAYDVAALGVGSLFAQILSEARPLAQLDRAYRERANRTAGALWIVYGRWLAASALASPFLIGGDAGGAGVSRARDRISELFGVDAGRAWPLIASLQGDTPYRFDAYLLGLEAWTSLRESYNEDWYRNPRASEAIRALSSRGAAGTPAELRAELQTEDRSALARTFELFPT